MEKEFLEHGLSLNRRKFLSILSLGLGSAALGSLLIPDLFSGKSEAEDAIMAALPHCSQSQASYLPFSKWGSLPA